MPLFDELADPAVVAHLSAEAEEAGWHGVFVWDNLRYQEPVVDVADPWITLTAVATATVIETPRESAPVPEQEPQPAAAS